MYAIVDIETTGGNAASGAITEIAILLHNGREVEGRFSSLINPLQNIPRYITALTGISNQMVADAPTFADLAPQIFNLLSNRVFVAHNVNFDYSFIHHHLMEAGIHWQGKKVCTVRYARKVVPGLNSYSLGKLCGHLGIPVENRHRAEGDAEATAILWQYLLQKDEAGKILQGFVKGKTAESYLPLHVPLEELEKLPYCAGVYYFKDKAGKIIYVGKAKNLKYRIRSHFANNSSGKRKQEFLRNIHHIEYTACVSEMMAIILEELEIKKLWPLYNRSQKHGQRLFGLYAFEDQLGYKRLAVEKRRKHLPALYSFHQLEEGYTIARQLMKLFSINEDLLFATGLHHSSKMQTDSLEHNQKMKDAINYLQNQMPSLLLFQDGEDEQGNAKRVYYWIEKGLFKAMGVGKPKAVKNNRRIISELTTYPDNEMVKATLMRFAEKHPENILQVD